MYKTEKFNELLSVVSEVTEIPAEVIRSKCRNEDVVNARYLLTHLLHTLYGLSAKMISPLMNMSYENVLNILHGFDKRKNCFRILNVYNEIIINKVLGNA